MTKIVCILFVIIAIVLTLSPIDLKAGWSPYGMSVCSYEDAQRYATAIPDGEGGALIVWEDFRESYSHVYCQRINAAGDALWTTNGIAICTTDQTPSSPVLTSDGSGGVIIAWQDIRHGSYWQIYAQRINSAGTVMWTSEGVRVTNSLADEEGPEIVTDGAGGAIIAWTSNYSPSGTGDDIYASRIDSAGAIVWGGTGGNVVSTQTGNQYFPYIVSDEAGGAIMVWTDERSGLDRDIYAQKVNNNGTMLWTAGGAPVSAATGHQDGPVLVYDGAGAAIFAWTDDRNGTNEIYAARLNQFGGSQTWWNIDGNPIIQSTGYEMYPIIVSDGAGGAIIGWLDTRNATDLYVQRVDPRSNKLWASDGIRVTPDANVANPFSITSDGANGAIVSWFDTSPTNVLTAQRIDRTGTIKWDADGIKITEGMASQGSGSLISTNKGGAIAVFNGQHLDYDLYAQRIDHYGEWGSPNPILTSAVDVPADQGGNVLLTWEASYLDKDPYEKITHYSVWRKLSAEMVAMLSSRMIESTDPAKIDRDFNGEAYIFSIDAATAAGWEWITNQDAAYMNQYSYAASTLYDSIAGFEGIHEFSVLAHTADPYVSWASDPIEGYSVDDLAPSTPVGMAGTRYDLPDRLLLSWNENTENDLSGYNLYRGPDSEFPLEPASLIATTADNYYSDTSWLPDNNYFYKLAAVDIHGNIGGAMLLSPEDVIMATELQAFASSIVDGAIIITWTLSEAGEEMRFIVCRATLPDRDFKVIDGVEISGGDLEYRLSDPAAIAGESYIYRIIVEDEEGSRTLFETEAIELPRRNVTLFQNYPNPFNPATRIGFYLPEQCWTSLDIYDSSGRKVKGLLDEMRLRGPHTVTWNGLDDQGNRVSSGVYFYRVRAGKVTISSKMVLLR